MFYFLQNKDTPWDLTDILWEGFVPMNEVKQQYYIERSGPFIPEIYEASGSLIFTDKAKLLYEQSSLSGIVFSGPLEKRKIVNIDWQTWDFQKDWTDVIGGYGIYEPDEIIDALPHDPILAKQVPECWQAKIDALIHVNNDHAKFVPHNYDSISIPDQALPNVDFFVGDEFRAFIITERAKQWLEKHFSAYLDFYVLRSE